MDTSIEERVKAIVSNLLGLEAGVATSEGDFINNFGGDSLDTIRLMVTFEEAFAIEIPEEDRDRLRTIGDVVNYIQGKTGAA